MANLILNKELTPLPTSQAGAPSSTPAFVGAINVDTTSGYAYISKATSSSADWVKTGETEVTDTETTTDDTPTEVTDITAAANTAYFLKYKASCVNSDATKAYVSSWNVAFTTAALMETPTCVEFKLVPADGMTVSFAIDTGHLKASVTGIAATTLHWNISYHLFTFAY